MSRIYEGGKTDRSMEEGKGGGGKASLVSDSIRLKIEDISIALDQPHARTERLMARKPRQCMPKATLLPTMHVRSSKIMERIEYMQDHVLIGNFVGMHPL